MLVEPGAVAPAAQTALAGDHSLPRPSIRQTGTRGQTVTLAPMPPVPADEYASASVRRAVRREKADRRAAYRAKWWFPLLVLMIGMAGCWGLLKTDQLVADTLIWPSRGAQFVEVGPVPDNPDAVGGPMMIVVGGLNRKSGTGAAAALMPALTVGHTRVFSLIYGSGINDQDILDKFDALTAKYQPREVSFFGSSMGGDVVLNLAAHAQDRRNSYRQDLLAPLGASEGTGESPGQLTGQSGIGQGAAQSVTPGASRERAAKPASERIGSVPDAADQDLAAAVGMAIVRTQSGQSATAAPGAGTVAGDGKQAVPPRLGIIFLDCSPLTVDDVRDVSRTQADLLTGLTEGLHTDGGVAARLAAELLAQQSQWSTGRLPFLQIRPADLSFKFGQVWREKIGAPGISTQLIKDQYGVIRRLDIDDVADSLGPGTRIVYFRPVDAADDHTVRVDRVEARLRELADREGMNLHIIAIPGGHHASAESNSDTYRAAISASSGGGT